MKYLKLFLLIPLAGCAGVMNGLAPTDCYDATSGSVSLNGSVLKPAEVVRFCPPSIRKVSPEVAVVKP